MEGLRCGAVCVRARFLSLFFALSRASSLSFSYLSVLSLLFDKTRFEGAANADGSWLRSFSLHYTTRSDVTVAGA